MLTKLFLTSFLLVLFHLKSSLADISQCEEGYLCIWTEENYGEDFYKFDENETFWEDNLDENDSSWANHAEDSRPDSHVLIFDQESYRGNVTLCLKPGQKVPYNSGANKKGASLSWVPKC